MDLETREPNSLRNCSEWSRVGGLSLNRNLLGGKISVASRIRRRSNSGNDGGREDEDSGDRTIMMMALAKSL